MTEHIKSLSTCVRYNYRTKVKTLFGVQITTLNKLKQH